MGKDDPISLLVVEDDLQLRTLYARSFQLHDVRVLTAAGLLDARGILATTRPAAVILDIGLEDESGLALMGELPEETVVVVVTGYREKNLVRKVLASGADDLVFKPFAIEELTARVLGRVEARRRIPVRPLGEDGCLQIDLAAGLVLCSRESRQARLSRSEAQALSLLIDARGEVVSRETLSREVHGEQWDPSSRRIDALMSRVRRKLECAQCGAQRAVSTVHNHGYRLTGAWRAPRS